MNKTNQKTLYLVHSALIAALYAAVTYFCAPISFGSLQFRVSEALTILPVLSPAAIPGLTIGCLISNLSSPYGLIDIICGTAATLLAAICSRWTRNIRFKNMPLLSALFPVIFNGVIIGLEIAFLLPEGFSWMAFASIGASVAFGEVVVCYILGLPLFAALNKAKVFENWSSK